MQHRGFEIYQPPQSNYYLVTENDNYDCYQKPFKSTDEAKIFIDGLLHGRHEVISSINGIAGKFNHNHYMELS
jgi:hypothetical protein